MTRHSTLTNPNDLHYAKVRTFSGDPNLVYPDFADQLLIASDSKRIYASTSTDQGAIVQLVANIGENLVASVELTNSPPTIRPNASGKLLLDTSSNSFYASVLNPVGVYWWRRVADLKPFLISSFSTGGVNATSTDLLFKWFYSPFTDLEIASAPFDFTLEIATISGVQESSLDFSDLVYTYGPGAYTIGYEILNPSAFDGLNLSTQVLSLYDIEYQGGSGVRSNPSSLTCNGLQVSSDYLYVYDLPPNSFNGQIGFDFQLITI